MAIDPPDFETRAAILLDQGARARGVDLPEDVAFLIAKRMRSNVRDLEGALNTLVARANFLGRPITAEFAQETLRDLLTVHSAGDHDLQHPEDRGRLLSAAPVGSAVEASQPLRWRGRGRWRWRWPRN